MDRKLVIDNNEDARRLFGQADEHLRKIRQSFPVDIVARGNEIVVKGDKHSVERVMSLFQGLLDVIDQNGTLSEQDVRYGIRLAIEDQVEAMDPVHRDLVVETAKGRRIKPKTVGQKHYMESVRQHDLVFCIGPAGTGKTYMAMAAAVAALKNDRVRRIVLTRPAVEAGENLGFLPGDLQEKVDPYLRPLYDAMYDILGVKTCEEYMGRGVIEVAPLAYMRGRTLDDSFVILDEAQNTTPKQMKMFLTRLGFGSKAVVTGDVTQIDLPRARARHSGLEEAEKILSEIDAIDFVHLTKRDVVRHPLVEAIIEAYDRYENARYQAKEAGHEDGDRGSVNP